MKFQPISEFERGQFEKAIRQLNPAEQDRLQQAFNHALTAEMEIRAIAKEHGIEGQISEIATELWNIVWDDMLVPVPPRPVLDPPVDLADMAKQMLGGPKGMAR